MNGLKCKLLPGICKCPRSQSNCPHLISFYVFWKGNPNPKKGPNFAQTSRFVPTWTGRSPSGRKASVPGFVNPGFFFLSPAKFNHEQLSSRVISTQTCVSRRFTSRGSSKICGCHDGKSAKLTFESFRLGSPEREWALNQIRASADAERGCGDVAARGWVSPCWRHRPYLLDTPSSPFPSVFFCFSFFFILSHEQ